MPNQHIPSQNDPFPGFSGPNYTQVPDALFDELLPVLSGAELKVLLYVIRRTFGFKRDTDTISLGQMVHGIVKRDGTRLDYGAGVSKKTLLAALRSLEQRQILLIERRRSSDRGDEASVYRLNIIDEATRGVKTTPGGGAKLHQGGGVVITPGGGAQNYTTQETVLQKTVLQKTDVHLSNIRKVEPGGKQQGGAVGNTQAHLGPEGVGAILHRGARGHTRAVPPGAGNGASGRPEAGDEDFQRIQHIILTSQREFGDRASAKSSSTRAWNLYQKAGYTIGRFEEALYQARSLTKEATAQITSEGEDPTYGVRRKIKMPYFFAVLEDVLGLRPAPEKPAPAAKAPRKAKGSSDRRYLPHIET